MTAKKILVKNITTGVTEQDTVNLAELAGVVITNPMTDDVMRFNGTDFVNSAGSAEVEVTGEVLLTSTAYGKMHLCSGTSANYTVELPSAVGNEGKSIAVRMSTALTKLVTINGGAPTVAKTGTVSHPNSASATLDLLYVIGADVTLNSGGSGINPGDTIGLQYVTWTYYIVDHVDGNVVHLTTTPNTYVYTAANCNLYTVVGVDTAFTTDYVVGHSITIEGEIRTVAAIADNTHLTVTSVFTNTASGVAHSGPGTPALIDGVHSRIMWANESALLLCDGVNWSKIAGKSIAMSGSLSINANQTFNVSTNTKLVLTYSLSLTGPTAFQDSANSQFLIVRPGDYYVSFQARQNGTNTSAHDFQYDVVKNSSVIIDGSWRAAASVYPSGNLSGKVNASLNDTIFMSGYYGAGAYTTSFLLVSLITTVFSVMEIVTW
jgi:hypothetical protein